MKQLIGVCSVLFIIISLSSYGFFDDSEPEIVRLTEHTINTSSGITQGQSYAFLGQ